MIILTVMASDESGWEALLHSTIYENLEDMEACVAEMMDHEEQFDLEYCDNDEDRTERRKYYESQRTQFKEWVSNLDPLPEKWSGETWENEDEGTAWVLTHQAEFEKPNCYKE